MSDLIDLLNNENKYNSLVEALRDYDSVLEKSFKLKKKLKKYHDIKELSYKVSDAVCLDIRIRSMIKDEFKGKSIDKNELNKKISESQALIKELGDYNKTKKKVEKEENSKDYLKIKDYLKELELTNSALNSLFIKVYTNKQNADFKKQTDKIRESDQKLIDLGVKLTANESFYNNIDSLRDSITINQELLNELESETLTNTIEKHINLVTRITKDKELKSYLMIYLKSETSIAHVYNKPITSNEYSNLIKELDNIKNKRIDMILQLRKMEKKQQNNL